MKIQSSRYTKRNLFLISLVLLILLLVSGSYAYTKWLRSDTSTEPAAGLNTVDYSSPTDEQQQAGQAIKDASVNGSSDKPSTSDEGSEGSPSDDTVQVSITAANQNGQVLNIRNLIETVTSTGTCTLSLTKDSVSVIKTSGIQALANSSTCMGFDVPISELSPGQWRIQLKVTAGTKSGEATKDITIQ